MDGGSKTDLGSLDDKQMVALYEKYLKACPFNISKSIIFFTQTWENVCSTSQIVSTYFEFNIMVNIYQDYLQYE